jgi:hypothetical protein
MKTQRKMQSYLGKVMRTLMMKVKKKLRMMQNLLQMDV